MTIDVPNISPISSVGRFWSAWHESWRIPTSLITLWWYSAATMCLPHGHDRRPHGDHDQLSVPDALGAETAPTLFA